jgi:hypothetical protein
MKLNLMKVRRALGAFACGAAVVAGTAGAAQAQRSWQGGKHEAHEREKSERREMRDERRDERQEWRAARRDTNRQQQWQRVNSRWDRRDGNFWNRNRTTVNQRFVRSGRLHYAPGRGYFRDNGRRAYRTHR